MESNIFLGQYFFTFRCTPLAKLESLTRIMSIEMLMPWLDVASTVGILSGASCRYSMEYHKDNNSVKGMPSTGKADHNIVYVEYDIEAKRIQQAVRKVFLYTRADMEGLRDHLPRCRDSFLSSDHSHMSVNDMWVSLSEVLDAIGNDFDAI